jgi:hypothetical protein
MSERMMQAVILFAVAGCGIGLGYNLHRCGAGVAYKPEAATSMAVVRAETTQEGGKEVYRLWVRGVKGLDKGCMEKDCLVYEFPEVHTGTNGTNDGQVPPCENGKFMPYCRLAGAGETKPREGKPAPIGTHIKQRKTFDIPPNGVCTDDPVKQRTTCTFENSTPTFQPIGKLPPLPITCEAEYPHACTIPDSGSEGHVYQWEVR